ncbi:AP-4 complex accessory subunit tepsin isoform X2 [Thamnophis elegans]|uniref:AP-4 complex accessory subunit tepsin isoform X2 n=1 Tax=Thamnophis elegans TaxID=35005 RepID=UPI001376C217|nr:AP-4 complex accessory subunit tepsin isoform X2 [Thamnophis elegans]
MAAVPLRDRLSFLTRLPTLIKGTSDDEVPCPGYLLEEIAKISHESTGSSHCLLEYLLNRLQSNSCHIKLKVLKILLYMCTHGSSPFLLQLKRNSSFIQEAIGFTGPPDPLHGNSLHQKVRMTAQDLAGTLFSDVLLPQCVTQPSKELPSSGMGNRSRPPGSLEGFGFEKNSSVNHQPGQAGGGWEDLDTGLSSQNSLQENSDPSRTWESGSKASSDNHSSALEPSSGADRMEAENLNDCLQEMSLVNGLTRGSKVFLTREETQHFIKECGVLNCEVVLALLNRTLKDPSECICMRAMCAISSLMCSDLLSQDHIFAVTQKHLQELSEGSPGCVANKATKILRQCEALCRSYSISKNPSLVAASCSSAKTTLEHADDLLTNTVPFSEDSFLKPINLSLQLSQAPQLLTSNMFQPAGQMPESLSCGQLDILPPDLSQQGAEGRLPGSDPQEERPPRGDPDGTVSLFAGMELIAPSSMTLAASVQGYISPGPQAASLPGNTRDSEDNQQLSAFPFLHV